MSKTLAELRQSPHVGLPKKIYPLCLAGALQSRLDELYAELDLIPESTTPSRMGAKSDRVRKEAEIEAVIEEMNEHLVSIVMQAKPGHEWRQFVNAHPPREDQDQDQMTGFNIDAVIMDLPDFILTVNDAPLGVGDWAWIVENAADGDLKNCVGLLINMHNKAVDVPKSPKTLRQNQENESD